MSNDMRQGRLTKPLLMFSIPLILSGLLLQLFNWADAMVVGNIEGDLALAAIGASGTVPGVFVLVITGFTSGIGILSAQMYGNGQHQDLKRVLFSFALTIGTACTVLGFAGSLFAPNILRALHTAQDTVAIASQYLRIYMLGTPFVAIYNVYAAVLRGCGDSKAAFFAISVSSLINLILDVIFVAGFHWGAAGAAVATVFSQSAMAVFIVGYTGRKYGFLRLNIREDKVDQGILLRGVGMGLPIAVQSSIKSVGNLALQSFMNGFGSLTVAAITTAYRIDNVVMLPVIHFGTGIATAVAQNSGTGDVQRARKSLYIGMCVMAVISLALTGIVVLGGQTLLSLFGLSSISVKIGTDFFQYIARFYLVFGVATAIRNYLDGCGDVVFTSIVNVVAMLIRVAVSYRIGNQCGNDIFALAESISWGILLGIYMIRYLWITRGPARKVS